MGSGLIDINTSLILLNQTFYLDDEPFSFRFHGTGITYLSKKNRIHYDYFHQGLGVMFTDSEIFNFISQNDVKTALGKEEIEQLMLELHRDKILHRIFDDHQVYVVL